MPLRHGETNEPLDRLMNPDFSTGGSQPPLLCVKPIDGSRCHILDENLFDLQTGDTLDASRETKED